MFEVDYNFPFSVSILHCISISFANFYDPTFHKILNVLFCSFCLFSKIFILIFIFLPQILSPLLDLNQNRNKLKLYISHLTSLCQERDPIILQDFAPPPAYHRSDSASWNTELHSMTQEQVFCLPVSKTRLNVCWRVCVSLIVCIGV